MFKLRGCLRFCCKFTLKSEAAVKLEGDGVATSDSSTEGKEEVEPRLCSRLPYRLEVSVRIYSEEGVDDSSAVLNGDSRDDGEVAQVGGPLGGSML